MGSTQTSAAQLADLFEHHSQLPSASQLVILSQDTLLREVKTTRATPKATEAQRSRSRKLYNLQVVILQFE